MNSIVNEKMESFKAIEQKVFGYVCEFGRNLIQIILESYDKQLMETRNKSMLRNKGQRQTTIKTVMGPVEYSRNVYQTKDAEGHRTFVYLLDQEMEMDKIGMISTNLAEKIASVVSENSYQATAEIISSTSGQSISHGGAWILVQKLGERIRQEEAVRVSEMDAEQARGKREVKVLFEEMDGVWLRMQGAGHKSLPKQEMKVAVMYEGWENDGKSCSKLSGKHVIAGMETSKQFHDKREAQLRSIYDADEIEYRILNGDGGSWIRDPYEPEVVFQLDRFHIEREIKRKLTEKGVSKRAEELFRSEKYEELLSYIEIYATSVSSNEESDKRSHRALELHRYLLNNKEGLIPWQKQRANYPEPPDEIVYKNMGVMENQNCTTITLRMKGGRRRWSKAGADHMGKVLYTRENGELSEVIGRYTDGLIYAKPVEEILKSLSAAKAPKKDGKGNVYIDICRHHMPMLEALQTEARKVFRKVMMN